MPSTDYTKIMKRKAEQTHSSPEFWKYHNVKSRATATGFQYKCECCHDEEENWMSEYDAKKHIHTKKHINVHTYYKQYIEISKKYQKAHQKLRDLEKELFQYKGVNRIKSFLDECEESDYIMKCEDDEVQMPNGKTIVREISYSVAPTSFDEIFYDFSKWCEDKFTGEVCKDSVKKYLLEHQKNSAYGLDIGDYEEELKKNGTYDKPLFNFTYIETSQ